MTTISQILNQRKLNFNNINRSFFYPQELQSVFKKHGCVDCSIRCGTNRSVVYRGNQNAKKMIIGEAPGRYEHETGKPFVGPAGQLLDKIFIAVGWQTDKDWYVTNVVKGRPLPEKDSNKQNRTPVSAEIKECRKYLLEEIAFLKPHTIVLIGATAAESLLGRKVKMTEEVGQVFFVDEFPGITFFLMYHPAYILNQSKYPDKMMQLKRETFEHVKLLRQIVDENEL